MPQVTRMCSKIREQGRRLTPQRQAIVRALMENCTHPTAEQIIRCVRTTMPDISHATVYNTLHELEDLGLLQEIALGVGERHYDLNTDDHDHILCLGCGRLEDVAYEGERPNLAPGDGNGFAIVGHRVLFTGYCAACKGPDAL